MGIGSKIKSAGRKLDSTARSVAARPFSRDSLETVAPLVAGVPLPTGQLTKATGIDATDEKAGGYGKVQKTNASTNSKDLVRLLLYPKNEDLKAQGNNVATAGIAVGVVLVCVYASAFCGTAVTLGLAGLGSTGFLGNVMTLLKKVPGLAGQDPNNNLTEAENVPGDSGPGGADDQFSLDPNTPNGKRNLAILAALGGAVALYYTIRYVRK